MRQITPQSSPQTTAEAKTRATTGVTTQVTQDLIALLQTRDDPGATRALLAAGADPDRIIDDNTPLIAGVMFDRIKSVRMMLAHGADVARIIETDWRTPSPWAMIRARPLHPTSYLFAPLRWLATRRALAPDGPRVIRVETVCCGQDMARLLAANGADPAAFDDDYRLAAGDPKTLGTTRIAPRQITPEMFTQSAAPRPGRANPERCETPFYIEQIRTGRSSWQAGRDIIGKHHRASCGDDPVWSFQRFGQSVTQLPDGRLVLIGGEHEDHYDPDFHIYNDVVVLDGKGGVALYLYPRLFFPPTDSHTATLDAGAEGTADDTADGTTNGNAIWIVGSLGYTDRRDPTRTQVLRLDLDDMSVNPVPTTGQAPPWLNNHSAQMHGREIFCHGGKIEPGFQDNPHTYALNVDTHVWRRLAD
ncbi:hypothetical protein ACP2AV_08560 [Aliiroseovarius sp. PTFE2010]|uniref:hypothetical protein n=1 Tax=Aliiroseovarius sp. PTFE2010 TaxID=3417190 RepID=UPI003CEA5D05